MFSPCSWVGDGPRAFVFVVAGLLAACSSQTVSPTKTALPDPSHSPRSTSSTAASPSTSAGPPAYQLDEVAGLDLVLGRGADWPVELDGSLWVLVPDADDGPAIVRADPETGVEQARIELGGQLCEQLTAAHGSIWACGDGEMLRIDPATNTVAERIPFMTAQVVGRPAATDNAVWSLSGNVTATSVTGIDAATNTVIATYDLGHAAQRIAASHDDLWVTTGDDGALLRVDPMTGEVTEALSDLPGPTVIAAGAGALWVLLFGTPDTEEDGEAALLRYDPDTGETDRFHIDGSPGGAGDIVASESGVWVRGSAPLVVMVDPTSGEVLWSVERPGLGDGSVGIGDGVTWVTDVDRGRVWRIDPPD